jgi:Cu-Zn family superoxide dismutase
LAGAVLTTVALQPAIAATVKAQVALTAASGPGAGVGAVTFADTPNGAHIEVALHGLPPGRHAFAVHANPSCEPGPVRGTVAAAGAAGPRYDASTSGGPGDLPFLTVASDGSDHESLTATGVADVSQLKNRSVVIEVVGGEDRLACGVIR